MKKMKVLVFAMFFISTMFCTIALADTLKVAAENNSYVPWVLDKNATEGVDVELIKIAGKNLGHTIEFVTMPWKRCLDTLQKNKVDGVFSASYKDKRLKYGVYPMANGKHDGSKRLHTDSYSLWILKDSNVGWDGDAFSNLTQNIGAQRGYSIIDKLIDKGAKVYEGNDAISLMKMLSIGRIDGVATLTTQGDSVLAQDAALGAKIKKITAPLAEKPYYMMFSHEMNKNKPELVKAFWTELEKVRTSDLYKQIYDKYMSK